MYIFKYVWTNGAILAMFIIGTKYNIDGFLYLSLVLYWAMSILGLTLFNNDVSDKMIKSLYSNGKPFIPLTVNVGYDLIITIMLAYYNYPILAFFYLIHILAQSHYYDRREIFIAKESNIE